MKKLLWNPFETYAGTKALIVGLSALVATSVLGFISCTHFPDLLSVKIGVPLELHEFFLENLIAWFTSALVFYLLALGFSKSRVRIIDFLGTMALARWPYFIAAFAGFVGSMSRLTEFAKHQLLGQGDEVIISTQDIVISILIGFLLLLITIWYVALLFHAFRISSNLKQGKLIVVFILGVLISWVASGFLVAKFIVSPFVL